MNSWLMFWQVLLIGAFTLFGLLAIIVAVGGLFDIRTMFRRVDAQHDADPTDHQSAP